MDGNASRSGSARRRRLIAGLAGLIPVVPILAALVISSGTVTAEASGTSSYVPANLGPSSPSTAVANAGSGLPSGPGALVAFVRHRTELRSSPAGHAFGALPLKTEFGSPEILWVVRHTGSWLGVVSTQAGNGHIAWIPRSVTTLARNTWVLKVSISARRLTVINHGRTVETYSVAVGRSDAPTPTGRFAVTDRLNTNDPTGPYGCCILALSAQSPHAIQGWSGGNRIAIHSTPETASIGQPDSHGCVRVTLAEGRWLLAHIPLGTPTLISS